MDFSNAFKQYWPFLLLALWFGYKWWNARKVAGLLPGLKQRGATLVDVRSAAEYASGHAPGTLNIPLRRTGQPAGRNPQVRRPSSLAAPADRAAAWRNCC
jgi:phage shock protein E